MFDLIFTWWFWLGSFVGLILISWIHSWKKRQPNPKFKIYNSNCVWCKTNHRVYMQDSWWNKCYNCGCIWVVSTGRIDVQGDVGLQK